MKKYFLISILFTLIFATEYSGFYRNQFTVYNIKSPILSDINKARIRIESEHFVGEFDGLTFHGFDENFYESPQFSVNQAYAEFDFGMTNTTIGKQIILWGSGMFWNPTDIFNELPMFDPKIDFSGTNAIRTEIATGDFSYCWGAFSPESSLEDSRFVLRNVLNVWNSDFGVSYLKNGQLNQEVIAFDVKSQLYGANWWVETAKFTTQNYFTYIVGFDYTINIGNGVYFGAEYFHDESGENNFENYDLMTQITENRRTLAKDYIFGMVNYSWSYIANSNIVSIINLNDESFIINPSISISPLQDVEVILGGYIPIGENRTEYRPDFSDYPDLPELMRDIIGKEMLYLWVEVNF
jgi:hypothetical protein